MCFVIKFRYLFLLQNSYKINEKISYCYIHYLVVYSNFIKNCNKVRYISNIESL